MSLPLSQYLQVKDRICIGYFGFSDEYLVQLRVLRPNVEKVFPGLSVWLACRDDGLRWFRGEDRVVSLSRLKASRHGFGKVFELGSRPGVNPVEALLAESGVPVEVKVTPRRTGGHCLIVPPLAAGMAKKVMDTASARGYRSVFGDDLGGAGWVVGEECAKVYEAAASGIATSLVSGGGASIFPKMFPGYEVLEF